MRMSRKAAIANPIGTRWLKYNATQYYEEYYLSDYYKRPSVYTVGSDQAYTPGLGYACDYAQWTRNPPEYWLSVCGQHSADSMSGKFIGSGSSLTQLYPYKGFDGVNHIYGTKVWGYTGPYTDYYYGIGNFVKNIYAPEGDYPDAKNGYAYVTVENGYTIMTYGGQYYAYVQA